MVEVEVAVAVVEVGFQFYGCDSDLCSAVDSTDSNAILGCTDRDSFHRFYDVSENREC